MRRLRACLLLILAGFFLAPLACGGKAEVKPSETPKAAPAKEPEKPAEQSLAFKALEAMLRIPADAPAKDMIAALSVGYLRHAERLAAKARDGLALRAGYSSLDPKKRKKFLEVMIGGALDVDDYVIFKEFNEKVNEQSRAVFGRDWAGIKDMGPADLRDRWLAGRESWKEILPDLEGMAPAGERDFGDRVYITYEGDGRKVEIAMIREQGGYKYAGTWDERNEYLLGPDRALLFDGKTDADRLEAARNDLSDIQSPLLRFRQKLDRFPTGQEGLDALLVNPGGPEADIWAGPYAHHVVDPWGNRWRLDVPGKHHPESFDLWSAGPDGKDGTEDDLKNW
jgi:general secretion pathway protein G